MPGAGASVATVVKLADKMGVTFFSMFMLDEGARICAIRSAVEI